MLFDELKDYELLHKFLEIKLNNLMMMLWKLPAQCGIFTYFVKLKQVY